jgi:hypothetical protein
VPHVEDRVVPRETNWKGKHANKFLRSCVEIMKDETMLSTLYDMIDHCT